MKKILCLFLFGAAINFAFSEKSIDEVLKTFDNALLRSASTTAQTAIGFITYADTNTSGTVVTYFQEEIEKAANNTRRIKIVPSSQLDEQSQVVVATRGLNTGMKKHRKNQKENEYAIDGIYIENKDSVELTLSLLDGNGNTVISETAIFSLSDIKNKKLTLYPQNVAVSQIVQKDFEKAKAETSNGKIMVTASMVDMDGNLVNTLQPGDTVRFIITVNSDAYIAIQGIDAQQDVYWLPVEDSYIPAGTTRIFPDGDMEYQVMNGVFGAEQLIIHAASSIEGLPNQSIQGLYSNGMINKTRGFGAVTKSNVKNDESIKTGLFKISYTVVE